MNKPEMENLGREQGINFTISASAFDLGVNDIFKTISIPSASICNSLMEEFLVPFSSLLISV
jgi:hypothetical protein